MVKDKCMHTVVCTVQEVCATSIFFFKKKELIIVFFFSFLKMFILYLIAGSGHNADVNVQDECPDKQK